MVAEADRAEYDALHTVVPQSHNPHRPRKEWELIQRLAGRRVDNNRSRWAAKPGIQHGIFSLEAAHVEASRWARCPISRSASPGCCRPTSRQRDAPSRQGTRRSHDKLTGPSRACL